MQFLTVIKYFEIQIFMLFLLAIADLIHTLSNNRSSIGMIGCYNRKHFLHFRIGLEKNRKCIILDVDDTTFLFLNIKICLVDQMP